MSYVLADLFSQLKVEPPPSAVGKLELHQTGFVWSKLPSTIAMAMNLKYARQALENPNLSVVLIPESVSRLNQKFDQRFVVLKDVETAFYQIHQFLKPTGQSFESKIALSAKIHPTAFIAAENVFIGENVSVGAFCYVGENSTIHDGCTLDPRVSVSSEGLFAKSIHGELVHIQHYGGVTIGKHSFIHSGVNIARSVMAGCSTEIGDHVHIGPQSVVGHDCNIGSGARLSALTAVAGRAVIGASTWVGLGAMVTNEVHVGPNADIKAGSVVVSNVEANGSVSGNFAIRHDQNLRGRVKS